MLPSKSGITLGQIKKYISFSSGYIKKGGGKVVLFFIFVILLFYSGWSYTATLWVLRLLYWVCKKYAECDNENNVLMTLLRIYVPIQVKFYKIFVMIYMYTCLVFHQIRHFHSELDKPGLHQTRTRLSLHKSG